MTLPLSSQQTFYNLFISILQDYAPQLTDTLDGSDIDALAGVCSLFGVEIQRQTILYFNKTFIDLANGPEITGGPDDLQTLVVDHYGDAFERPGAVAAVDTVFFSRPNNSAGAKVILAGSIAATQPDPNGNVQTYTTDSQVTLTAAGVVTFTISSASVTTGAVYQDANGNNYTATQTISSQTSLQTSGTTNPPASGTLTKISGTGASTLTFSSVMAPDCRVTVNVEAVVAGSAGNASAGSINVIQTALLDSSIVVTNAGNQTGEDAQDDATYRETIRNLIVALRAATAAAIQAAALAVPGVVSATPVLTESPVVFWNPATNLPLNAEVGGLYEYFLIPFAVLYVAQAGGPASAALVAEVQEAIAPYEAFGVNITVAAATTVNVNWSAGLTLNPEGPNFATFSSNTAQIVATMTNYIATLPTGTSFIRYAAAYYMLTQYGPAGTNDLIGNTTFTVTSANATAAAVYEDVNGQQYTVLSTIAGGTTLSTSSGMLPPTSSGTLTKVSGTGDTTITYSGVTTTAFVTSVPTADVSISSTENAIPGTIQTV
jgi:hypothetical protein